MTYDAQLLVRGAALRPSRSEPFGERFLLASDQTNVWLPDETESITADDQGDHDMDERRSGDIEQITSLPHSPAPVPPTAAERRDFLAAAASRPKNRSLGGLRPRVPFRSPLSCVTPRTLSRVLTAVADRAYNPGRRRSSRLTL
jgi:hypothetical protein